MASAQTLADVASAYLLNAQARADLKASSELALESALHDDLTGLPNRALLVQRLEHAILRCRRSGKPVAILYADLDDFKAVNDTHGHHVGDELLVALSERLSGLLRPGDTLARMAGDEFVILCEDLEDAVQVELIAERIGLALAEPSSCPPPRSRSVPASASRSPGAVTTCPRRSFRRRTPRCTRRSAKEARAMA